MPATRICDVDAACLTAFVQAMVKCYALAKKSDAQAIASFEKLSRIAAMWAVKLRITTQSQVLPEADFDEVDREALNRALQMTLAGEDRFHAERIKSDLATDGWWEAASAAAYHQQIETLGLKPWESPPCHCDEDDSKERDHGGVRLLKRMLSHNVSRWDPDPVAAIEAMRTK